MGYRLLTILFAALLGSCNIINSRPHKKTSEQRFGAFSFVDLPLNDSVSVYWNQYMVPFIEAKTDADAAFMLGVTHAHLRLAQMEIFRMIAWGRLAEMAGPQAADIDHSFRTLQLQKATHIVAETDDPFTLEWISNYVKGINWFIRNSKEKPMEYKLLNIEPSDWEVKDVYALSRLLSADLTWGVYFQSLSQMDSPEWDKIWEKFLANGQRSIPSFSKNPIAQLDYIIHSFSKSGSNSLAVSGSRTENGQAFMVSDPHLGIFAPNMWLIVGYKSPSFHNIGMQIPGIPVILLGRNQHFAWGGTNMRSISSHIFEIDEKSVDITSKKDTIRVRWLSDRPITLRESPYGTIVSDAPMLKKLNKTYAMHWLGHKPTYEVTAFLRSNMATNFEEFRLAFGNYQVSGQNMLYADEKGNIGQIMAYGQPVLKNPEATLDLIKQTDNPIVSVRLSAQQPYVYNPNEGFIASANNLPVVTDIPIAYQFTGYSRMERMAWYFRKDKVSFENLRDLQLDTYSVQNVKVRDYILERASQTIKHSGIDTLLWHTLRSWDGYYAANKRGPVAFEVFAYYLAEQIYGETIQDKDLRNRYFEGEYWAWDLLKTLEKLTNEDFNRFLIRAYSLAIPDFEKYKTWGSMHQMRLGPPQAMLPLIGKRFILDEFPLNGTSHTINKSSHQFTPEKHRIGYGSNSRHISDMSDKDANFFVLLGGQDGWTSSPHNNDQITLWQMGEYFQFPLRVETIRKEFKHRVFRFAGDKN